MKLKHDNSKGSIVLLGRTGSWLALVIAGLLVLSAPCNTTLVAQEEEGQAQEESPGETQQEGETSAEGEGEVQEETEQESPIHEVNPEEDAKPFASKGDLDKIEIPIMEREPFDRLTFDETNDKANGETWVLDVDPLEVEGVSPSSSVSLEDREGRLIFTMEQDYPGRRFATPWTSLTSIQRYSELVMEEAEKAMDSGDYGVAFQTLLYLSELKDVGQTARLKQMMDECLYEDGHENLEAGNFGEALTAFESLYQRAPRYNVRGPGETVLEKITICFDEFIGKKVADGDFASARSLLASLKLDYGNKVQSVILDWEVKMRKRVISRIADVKKYVEAGDGMAAHLGARDAMYVMPMKRSINAYNAVVRQFPYVFVGVTQQADSKDVRKIEDWAARRIGFTVNRWLMEFQRPTDEGGKYLFPAGVVRPVDELGVRFRIELSADQRNGVPPMRSYELADRLYELATVGSDEYYVPWARLVESIEIVDERSIIFTLKYPHVRPESLLVMPWFAKQDPRAVEPFGQYMQVQSEEGEAIYELNARYEKNRAEQNPRIIEKVYRDSTQSTGALIEGHLDVVDRVFPGDIARLKAHPDINVKPYLIPSVHMLIPNPRNDYMSSDHFRRALHFGINRKMLIRDAICGGSEIEGFEVVSGPFPKGTDAASDLAYAYNQRVEPREHSALLGLVLAQQYVTEKQNRLENEGETDVNVEMPKVVLAYPATETIAGACRLIAQQWRAIGVETELRALPPGVTMPPDDNYDLVYVETQMQEPLVDAYRLFGRNGLTKLVDPTIEQALRNLDSAYSWTKVSDALRRVHQQSANNLSVLPLWQVVDHYAYRTNVFNLGNDIVSLYENLNEWRIDGIQSPQE